MTAVACLTLAGVLASGCGSDSDSGEGPSGPRPPETAERVGNLPAAWETLANDRQGFEIGVPPGWGEGQACGSKAPAESAGTTLLCSPDRLVTLSVSVDRTDEALDVSAEESATRTAEAVSARSFDGKLEPGEAHPVKGHYGGALVEAKGRSGNLKQELEVVVRQREQLAAITAVIAANAEEDAEDGVKLAERAFASLRTKPVGS